MVCSWVSSHESEVDVIVYIVYTAVLLSSSILNCTVQCPYVVIREVDYVLHYTMLRWHDFYQGLIEPRKRQEGM